MDRDLYQTLGVDRRATQEEIKKAFRKLARTYHPDLNPNDHVAERQFREVQQAYEILGDPNTRAQYDRFGIAFFRRHEGQPAPKAPHQVVNEFMEAFFRREQQPQRRRGEDLKYYLTVSLEDAALGSEKQLTVPRERECPHCRGTGAEGSSGKVPCEPCQGLGEVRLNRGLFNFARPCPTCRGTGYRIVSPCKSCKGRGRDIDRAEIKVRIPAGVESGQRLKLRDRGNHGYGGGEAGDLYVIVNVKDHPLFKRQGTELLCDVPITFAQAALGGDIEVPTLEGRARITLPQGVQSGKLYRLKGQGLPRLNGHGGRGDLHARILVETPVNLNPEQRRLFEDLARATGPESTPLQSGLLDRLRSRLQGGG